MKNEVIFFVLSRMIMAFGFILVTNEWQRFRLLPCVCHRRLQYHETRKMYQLLLSTPVMKKAHANAIAITELFYYAFFVLFPAGIRENGGWRWRWSSFGPGRSYEGQKRAEEMVCVMRDTCDGVLRHSVVGIPSSERGGGRKPCLKGAVGGRGRGRK